MDRDGLSGFELCVAAVAGVGALLVGLTWAGASLALLVGGAPRAVPAGNAVDALIRLPSTMGEPAAAWAPSLAADMPGAAVYWVSTALAGLVCCLMVGCAVRRLPWGRVGSDRRRPLGVDARPRFASSRDLRPVLVRRATAGRFTLARHGRYLVATEDRQAAPKRRRRAGDRGAVALIGPSRSGKTTAAVAGVLEWQGPAVLSSVKADLLGVTGGWRTTLGEVRVYDPAGSTRDGGRAARWSPVDQAGTTQGSQRAARALCDAAPRNGVEGGLDFWLAQAEILLSALLWVAHHSHRDMGAVCDWILSQDIPSDAGTGEVRATLDVLLDHEDGAIAAGASNAAKSLLAVWDMDERTRSSVYATAQTLVWAWSDPGVAASARSLDDAARLDLSWLLSGANTLYLCAPIEDQARLAPAFGGCLNDLIGQVYRRVAETGQPLDPPLLVLIDEAAHTPMRSLPSYAATLAGLGVLLITVWQSLAQIESAYGKSSDTILTNHLTKVVYAGLSDGSSLRYLGQLLGEAEVTSRSRTFDDGGRRRGAEQVSTVRSPMAPAHALRQMRPGEALLVHGTLPPAHVRARPFYRSRHLRERASMPWPPMPGESQ